MNKKFIKKERHLTTLQYSLHTIKKSIYTVTVYTYYYYYRQRHVGQIAPKNFKTNNIGFGES